MVLYCGSKRSSIPDSEYVVEGVTAATVENILTEFEAYMGQIDQVGMWEALRKDFILGSEKLIIRFATAGHGVVTELIHLARCRAEPIGPENSNIIWGGSVDVPHRCGGKKTPDFGIFDRRRSNADVELKRLDRSIPTIAFEIAYSQTTQSLETTAAQHICFTLGHILLVVAIDISRVRDSPTRQIQSVTWSHWEEDPHFHQEVATERRDDEIDNIVLRISRYPPTFSATVHISETDKRIKIRATRRGHWRLYPNPEIAEINILQRHLFRGTSSNDVALSFKTTEVINEIFKREELQEDIDITAAPDTKRALEDYDVTKERVKQVKSDSE